MKYPLENGYLQYDQVGSGIPLLFIHGYPLSRKIWKIQLSELSENATIIAPDLRGHGESYPFEGPYPMDLFAEDCCKLLNAIKLVPPIFVCGLSMGGYITFALFRKHPELFSGMILTSTRAGPDSPEGKANRDLGIRNAREHGISSIADGMVSKLVSPRTLSSRPDLVTSIREIMLETSVNGVVGALQGMRDRPDSTPLLSEIKCPVLIIHGADDQLIPSKEAELMSGHIPNSHLVIIPNTGHLPNMEEPEKFNQALRDFILSITYD